MRSNTPNATRRGRPWQRHVGRPRRPSLPFPPHPLPHTRSPATRLDVINLQEQLDTKLQQRQARETGICPVRRELYSQVFDELIREVTINCSERGLLLLRIRDEIRMTLAAYQVCVCVCGADAPSRREADRQGSGRGETHERAPCRAFQCTLFISFPSPC